MTTGDDMPMTGIINFTDADVLCGRGGQAQKHVGNKTYRALVNLNKQLYASCRTTEKIKISRSIVAAIREQRGRFLDKEPGRETFYDIGDKKAVEKTSQALREGQPKTKKKMAQSGEPANNLTAAATRTSLNDPSQNAYKPPPAPQDFVDAEGQQLNMDEYARSGLNGISEQNEYRWDPNEHHHHQEQQQQQQQLQQQQQQQSRGRPTLTPGAQSDLSLMSDISASFAHMMQDEQYRSSFDATFQEAMKEIEVPDDPYYYGEDEGYSEMQPPPPRRMLETMDSFRRQLMGIASPQNSSMSLVSTVGSISGGSIIRNSLSDAGVNQGDIVVPPREDAPAVPAGEDYHFHARTKDAVDDLLSVGGMSKLSLMSGISESTLDAGAIAGSNGSQRMVHNGSSELTLDPALFPRGSSRRMAGNRGVSTRSAAMSEVSALDFLPEQDNEDDDMDNGAYL